MTLTGELAGAEPLRHTPAGIPLLSFTLAHRSLQVEAGHRRQVECQVRCVALGETANELSRVAAGTLLKVSGFLNRRNRLSVQLVLHATSTELVKETNDGNDEQGRPR